MGSALSRVLVDFSAARSPSPAPQPGPTMSIVPPVDPADDLARRVEEAYARGADEARMAADAEHEQALALALAKAEQERLADRARWTSEQGDALAGGLAAALEALETRIGDAVGHVLTPFLQSELRSTSVRALAESIATLLTAKSQPSLRISGPEDLLSALRERLDAGPVAIEWQPNGSVEVIVSADDSVIETEVQTWADTLSGAR
jgi:hypothetical protein